MALLAGPASLSRAQDASASADTARNTSTQASPGFHFGSLSAMDTYAQPSPSDSDLGDQLLLTPHQRYQAFTLSAGTAVNWTSNANYRQSNPQGDVYMSNYAQATVLPYLGSNFFIEGITNFSSYRYDLNPGLDFNALNVSAGILRVFREFDDVSIFLRYQYQDLIAYGTGRELLSEQFISTGFRKNFQFSRANALFISGEADFNLGGQPGYAQAHQFQLFVDHQIKWTRMLTTDLFYQGMVFDYRYQNRADLRDNMGLSISLRPWKWLTLYTTTWLGWNASNQTQYNFFAANLGGGVTAQITF